MPNAACPVTASYGLDPQRGKFNNHFRTDRCRNQREMLGLFVREAIRVIKCLQSVLIARRPGLKNLDVVDDVEKPVVFDNASGSADERHGSAPIV